MTVEELDMKIDKLTAEENELLFKKELIRKRNPANKRKQFKEIDEELKEKRNHRFLYEQIKD